MKVLITGAGGQLGRELVAAAPPGRELFTPSRRELDVCAADSVSRVVSALRPDVIINAAAYTAVDDAEAEPEAARRVNGDGAGHVARAAMGCNARLIHVSTDYVFGGAGTTPHGPADPVTPEGAYARSKAEGEKQVLALTRGAGVVVRTAWLYSVHGRNFVRTMLDLLRTRDRITVVNDQVGSPTWARTLAAALWRMVELPALAGIHHWTDAGRCTWHEFAVAIRDEAAALGLFAPTCEVVPVTTAGFPRPARRPAFSVLDTRATQQALGLTARPWRECLREMLKEVAGVNPAPQERRVCRR